MARHKDAVWDVPNPISTTEQAVLTVLMDIRDELKNLNRVFNCVNFTAIPGILRMIQSQTKRRRRRRKSV